MSDRRLFFALWPSDRQREQLRDIIPPALSTVEGQAVHRSNWHVTLVFIGTFPGERIPDLQAAVDHLQPIDVRLRFDTLKFWQRPKIAAMLPVTVPPELTQIVHGIEQALLPFSFTPNERTYRPHITVARKVRAFDTVRLARPFELSWASFELVESVPSTSGVIYRPLKQELLHDS